LSRRRVSLEKKPSTALSQEQDFGVRCKTKRGYRASQALTLRCLWASIVVEDDMNDLANRHLGLDRVPPSSRAYSSATKVDVGFVGGLAANHSL
jgi:hypothetical protein